jgi:hypothetical protein
MVQSIERRSIFLMAGLFFLVFCSSAFAGEMQSWTSATGKWSVDAEFVRLEPSAEAGESGVVLRFADGREKLVPLASLSEQSRQLARRLAAEQAGEAGTTDSTRAGAEGEESSVAPVMPTMEGDLGKQERRGLPVSDDAGNVIGYTAGIGRGYYSLDALVGVKEAIVQVDLEAANISNFLTTADLGITSDWVHEIASSTLAAAGIKVHKGKELLDEDGIIDLITINLRFGKGGADGPIIAYYMQVNLFQPVSLRREPQNVVLARTYATPGIIGYESPLDKASIEEGLRQELAGFVEGHTTANVVKYIGPEEFALQLSDCDYDRNGPFSLIGRFTPMNANAESFCRDVGLTDESSLEYCRRQFEQIGIRHTEPGAKNTIFLDLGSSGVLDVNNTDGVCFYIDALIWEWAELCRFPGLYAFVDTHSFGRIGAVNRAGAKFIYSDGFDYLIDHVDKTLGP